MSYLRDDEEVEGEDGEPGHQHEEDAVHPELVEDAGVPLLELRLDERGPSAVGPLIPVRGEGPEVGHVDQETQAADQPDAHVGSLLVAVFLYTDTYTHNT